MEIWFEDGVPVRNGDQFGLGRRGATLPPPPRR
jgi:hypothetical protein